MAAYMDDDRLEKFLVHILTPAYRIAEDDTIRDPQMGKSPCNGFVRVGIQLISTRRAEVGVH
jgi:hypothetical protein